MYCNFVISYCEVCFTHMQEDLLDIMASRDTDCAVDFLPHSYKFNIAGSHEVMDNT